MSHDQVSTYNIPASSGEGRNIVRALRTGKTPTRIRGATKVTVQLSLGTAAGGFPCNRKGHYCNERTLDSVQLCMHAMQHYRRVYQATGSTFFDAIVLIHGNKTSKNVLL